MPELRVVQLAGDWEVRVTPVPPHASFRWVKSHVQYPDKPPKPVVEMRSPLLSADAPPEIATALPDTPEWDAWMVALREWQDQCDKIRESKADEEMEFSLDYAIVDWRKKGTDDPWCAEPGADWEPRAALLRHNVDVSDDRRLAFIHYELLAQSENYNLVTRAAFPQGEADMSPVTEEEVSAALGSFRVGSGVPGESGSVGAASGSAGPRGQTTHQDVPIRQGNAAGGRKTNLARRLVYLVSGK